MERKIYRNRVQTFIKVFDEKIPFRVLSYILKAFQIKIILSTFDVLSYFELWTMTFKHGLQLDLEKEKRSLRWVWRESEIHGSVESLVSTKFLRHKSYLVRPSTP